MLFASFWSIFKDDRTRDGFMGNMEVPFDEVSGYHDVETIERYIKTKINRNKKDPLVSCVTLVTWKRFNT
jgi:hypothetical protein